MAAYMLDNEREITLYRIRKTHGNCKQRRVYKRKQVKIKRIVDSYNSVPLFKCVNCGDVMSMQYIVDKELPGHMGSVPCPHCGRYTLEGAKEQ